MPIVRYRDQIQQTAVPSREGISVLEISHEAGLTHYHQCRGTARCTTCRVRVLEGGENLSPRSGPEAQIALERGWPDHTRLACQARVLGDVTIARMVLEDQTAKALFATEPPAQPAEERSLAVMFCDLRNFTGFAAAHLPHDVIYVLNRFFREVCELVLENDGYIDKYIGDGFLAVFGLNKADPAEICLDATRAAARIPGRVRDLNKWLEKTFDTTFDIGIGLHFGPAVVGHTGHPLKMQLTVMGDTVNIASRVEGKTKLTNSRILATGAFASHVRPFVTTGRKHRFKLTRAGRWDTLEEIPVEGIKDPALLVQTGYDLVRTGAPTFAETFYQRLFALAPHLAVLFTATDMEIQRRMLMEMIGRAVQRIHRPEEIAPMLRELGARHATYGVKPEYYEMAGKALVETLELSLGDRFFPAMHRAWQTVYRQIAAHMMSGAAGGSARPIAGLG